MASAEGGSVPSGMGYAEGCPISSRLGVCGSVVIELPQRGSGQSPGQKRIWGIFKARERSFLYMTKSKGDLH